MERCVWEHASALFSLMTGFAWTFIAAIYVDALYEYTLAIESLLQ
jgi:hypothetical protein